MATASEVNKELVQKYKVDNTILESYFKNASNTKVTGVVFPLRLDNRQYCSPTDYQGDKPSCCGYTTAQILESLNWLDTGRIVQMDADQIYAKAKETDNQMG
jgi:phage-related protein